MRIVNLSRNDKHFSRHSAITASFEIGHEPGVVAVDRVYRLIATGRTGIIKRIHTTRQKEGSDWIGIVGASFDDNDGLRFILVRKTIFFSSNYQSLINNYKYLICKIRKIIQTSTGTIEILNFNTTLLQICITTMNLLLMLEFLTKIKKKRIFSDLIPIKNYPILPSE